MGNKDSNSHSRGWCHQTIPGRTADTVWGVESVSKGRKDKRLGGETPLRLQKSVLFLGNCHIGLASSPMLGMKNEIWVGGCLRGKVV